MGQSATRAIAALFSAIKGMMTPLAFILVAMVVTGCIKEKNEPIPVYVNEADADTDTDTDTDTDADRDTDEPIPDTGVDDADGDGFSPDQDCNDNDATVNPGALETCNGVDDNCDGAVDEGATATWYLDGDQDGYGNVARAWSSCTAPTPDYVGDATDCNDNDAAVNPSALEVCDDVEVDENCDGVVNGSDAVGAQNWFSDGDGDEYGDEAGVVAACEQPVGYADNADDCDDGRSDVHPDADESDCADPVDYNCDGSTQYADADSDGYAACNDCNDASATVHPTASEYCNGVNDDCDALTDEDDAVDATTWYEDADEDGFGNEAVSEQACPANQPSSTVDNATDCDDGDDNVNPDAWEVCDDADVDEDCSGSADDADASATGQVAWYVDEDEDGESGSSVGDFCDTPAAYPEAVNANTDCDEDDNDIYVGAPEIADGEDNDCDREVDEDVEETDTGDTGA